jgi:hypothetical protein
MKTTKSTHDSTTTIGDSVFVARPSPFQIMRPDAITDAKLSIWRRTCGPGSRDAREGARGGSHAGGRVGGTRRARRRTWLQGDNDRVGVLDVAQRREVVQSTCDHSRSPSFQVPSFTLVIISSHLDSQTFYSSSSDTEQ